jgi:hypothetical protein
VGRLLWVWTAAAARYGVPPAPRSGLETLLRGPCPPPRLQLWRAATNWLRTMAARVLGCVDLRMKIWAQSASLYRGFGIKS